MRKKVQKEEIDRANKKMRNCIVLENVFLFSFFLLFNKHYSVKVNIQLELAFSCRYKMCLVVVVSNVNWRKNMKD